MLTITGSAAITYASAHWLTLSTYTDPTAEAREGVSVEEARSIAREDPSLVYVTIDGEQIATLRDEAAHAGDESLADACARSVRASTSSARTEGIADVAVRDLLRYGSFHRRWDGYDAEVFQPQTITRAIEVVTALHESFVRAQTEPSEITPGPIADGRIDVEASCEGRRLIVTVEAGSDQVGIFYDDRGATHEGPARWESDDVEGWVRRLTGEDRVSAWVSRSRCVAASSATTARWGTR